MKIVLAHKFLHLTGGTEQYFRDLSAILESHGHETIPFALDDPKNPDTPYRKYFLPTIDYRNTSKRYRLRNLGRIVGRTLYSFEAKRYMDRLVREQKPDIAHLQSIEHHISPSILHTLRRRRVPMVQSVNTYKHVCASYRLYLFDRHETCQRCLYGKHYHAALTRCVKGSMAASVLAMIEMYLHGLMKVYHLIDRFIVPNRFMERQMLGAGYDPRKLVRLLNPLSLEQYEVGDAMDDFILYFGRIDPEKGVMTLIEAMAKLPKLRLVVVGDGQQMDDCVAAAKQRGPGNVEFVGPKWGDELKPYLLRCRLVVVPSLWFEPSPYVIYQALASGKAVVASEMGGMPDLITPETGRLAPAGDAGALAGRLESIAFDDAKLREMGRAARRWAEVNLSPATYYEKLMDVYEQARQSSASDSHGGQARQERRA